MKNWLRIGILSAVLVVNMCLALVLGIIKFIDKR